MKHTLILLIAVVLVLAGCRPVNGPGTQGQLTTQDSLRITTDLKTAIQKEIKKIFPADSMRFDIIELHFAMVNHAFIDTHILGQARVYHSMYTQKSNQCIDATMGNKDSAEIYNAMAAHYLDTVKLYKKLADHIRKHPATNTDKKIYYTQFQFIPVINGTAGPNSMAVMFFDKDFNMIEASAPKLLQAVAYE